MGSLRGFRNMDTDKAALARVTHRSKEVQDTFCRGLGGVPQFNLSPRVGAKGVEKKSVQQPPPGSFLDSRLRGNDILHGYCGGSTIPIIQMP